MQRIATAVLAAVVCIGVFFSGGCEKNKSSQGKIKIGFIVKQPADPWCQYEWKFARQAADKYGFELVEIAAEDGEKVLNGIENLGAQGAKGAVVFPADTRLGPSIVTAAGKYGMKIYCVDDQFLGSDGKPMADVPYMGISAGKIGQSVGKAIADEVKRRGWDWKDVGACSISYDEVETCRLRTEGAAAALIEAGMPKENIYKAIRRTPDMQGGMDSADIVITQHNNVKKWVIFSSNDEGVIGGLRAMENRGIAGDNIIAVGIGGNPGNLELEKPKPNGFHATVLISPKRHGFETAEFVYKWVTAGQEPPKLTLTEGILIDRSNFKQVLKEQGLE